MDEPEQNEGAREDAQSEPQAFDMSEPGGEPRAYAFDGWGMTPLELHPA